mmetsp:Transcript_4071/g.11804  ORF Transcript_4071/g.11804 Transcript_4071/m.11804 type:complete len:262 (-) Transcript_4071:1334-2119(-)
MTWRGDALSPAHQTVDLALEGDRPNRPRRGVPRVPATAHVPTRRLGALPGFSGGAERPLTHLLSSVHEDAHNDMVCRRAPPLLLPARGPPAGIHPSPGLLPVPGASASRPPTSLGGVTVFYATAKEPAYARERHRGSSCGVCLADREVTLSIPRPPGGPRARTAGPARPLRQPPPCAHVPGGNFSSSLLPPGTGLEPARARWVPEGRHTQRCPCKPCRLWPRCPERSADAACRVTPAAQGPQRRGRKLTPCRAHCTLWGGG